MLSFIDLPAEIHTQIVASLVARDVFALSAACSVLRKRLGPSNRFFWYSRLRDGLPDDPDSEPFHTLNGRPLPPTRPRPRPPTDQNYEKRVREYKSNLENFDPERTYWQEAVDLTNADPEGIAGCGSCLTVYYSLWLYTVFQVGESQRKRRFCGNCFQMSFWSMHQFAHRYPEVDVPSTVIVTKSDKPPVLPPGQMAVITSPVPRMPQPPRAQYIHLVVAKRLIEEQIGSFESANTPSARFLGQWAVKMKQRGQIRDRGMVFLVKIYTESFKRFHSILPPNRLHRCISEALLGGPACRSIPSSPRGGGSPSQMISSTDLDRVVSDIARYTNANTHPHGQSHWSLPRKPSLEAARSAAISFLLLYFGAVDSDPFELDTVFMQDLLRVHLDSWANRDATWMCNFSDAQFPTSENAYYLHDDSSVPPSPESPGFIGIRCYWCSREGRDDIESTRRHKIYSTASLRNPNLPWIAVHMMNCHSQYMTKIPRGAKNSEVTGARLGGTPSIHDQLLDDDTFDTFSARFQGMMDIPKSKYYNLGLESKG
ncbi:hypothetical protein H072_314 [Dactylellina haptotyla CBS 200.50]|uniref:F-box domain-containing protein n=1 Tax=Dactylellina haptotyla (strain CBS 200.50) TaxID=1284197 RepID=S8ART4_DACHA|nr:hypothetical protein H072_314 [Dactylellina haptotyla CBS 200.50]